MTAFYVHFKYSGTFLWPAGMFYYMFKTFGVHLKWRNTDWRLNCIPNALSQLSKYSHCSIPTAFHTFWSHWRKNLNGKTLQTCSTAPSVTRLSRNASQMHLDFCRNLKTQLECTSNAVGNGRTRLDVPSCSHCTSLFTAWPLSLHQLTTVLHDSAPRHLEPLLAVADLPAWSAS